MLRLDRHQRPARWRPGLTAGALLLGFAFHSPAGAQQPAAPLTLQDALALAASNNPGFRMQQNDVGVARWGVREAYASFIPRVTVGGGAQYVAAGTQRFGIFTGDDIGAGSTDYYLSDYFLRLDFALSGRTIFQAGRARAERTAAEATLDAARFTLATAVTNQYLLTLRAQDGVSVADRTLARARENFELVSARVRVGAVAATEGKQAEVERGRAEVALLQARNLLAAERLRLMEQLGVELGPEQELVTRFEVFEPTEALDQLFDDVQQTHPGLRALQATADARQAAVREARSDYLPSLTLSADWSGFTREIGDTNFLLGQAQNSISSQRENCEFLNAVSAGLSSPLPGYPSDCSGFVLTPGDQAELLAGNRAFPFNFQRQPLSVQARVSIPVFNGFARERQAETAEAAAADAREAVRAESLRLSTEIATRRGDVETAYQIVAIEERNREVAEEQLALARERYRLGAAAFLELLEAETSMATAERDYLNAVYNFHDAIAAMEAAVGRQFLSPR